MFKRVVVVPITLYGAETWNMREVERRKLDVCELKCLQGMLGVVSRMDRVKNDTVREGERRGDEKRERERRLTTYVTSYSKS